MPGFDSRRSAFGPLIAVVVLGVVLSACGGQSGSGHSQISRGAALTSLYDAIAAGPSWATAQDSTAVRANIDFAPGANARCGPDYVNNGPDFSRFVCHLIYRDAGGQPQILWFEENGNGNDILPMTLTQYQAFAANALAYARRHFAALKRPPNLFTHGASLVSRIQAEAKAQPRVSGTACGGSSGMQNATTATSVVTPGSYLIAGSLTSCEVAQVVATALGDSSNPGSAVLSVPDQTSGGRLKLRCHCLSRVGPVECVAPGVAVVYVGSYSAPLPPHR